MVSTSEDLIRIVDDVGRWKDLTNNILWKNEAQDELSIVTDSDIYHDILRINSENEQYIWKKNTNRTLVPPVTIDSIIQEMLRKITITKVKCAILVPYFPSKVWYNELLKLSTERRYISGKKLIKQKTRNGGREVLPYFICKIAHRVDDDACFVYNTKMNMDQKPTVNFRSVLNIRTKIAQKTCKELFKLCRLHSLFVKIPALNTIMIALKQYNKNVEINSILKNTVHVHHKYLSNVILAIIQSELNKYNYVINCKHFQQNYDQIEYVGRSAKQHYVYRIPTIQRITENHEDQFILKEQLEHSRASAFPKEVLTIFESCDRDGIVLSESTVIQDRFIKDLNVVVPVENLGGLAEQLSIENVFSKRFWIDFMTLLKQCITTQYFEQIINVWTGKLDLPWKIKNFDKWYGYAFSLEHSSKNTYYYGVKTYLTQTSKRLNRVFVAEKITFLTFCANLRNM